MECLQVNYSKKYFFKASVVYINVYFSEEKQLTDKCKIKLKYLVNLKMILIYIIIFKYDMILLRRNVKISKNLILYNLYYLKIIK